MPVSRNLKVMAGIVLMMSPLLSSADEHATFEDVDSFIARALANGAPTETAGVSGDELSRILLEHYGDTLQDATFRAREVVIEPGGTVGIHTHDDRPAMVYVLEGEVLEYRNDSKEPLVRKAGDAFAEGPEVAHWLENVSDVPARAYAVDILPAAQDAARDATPDAPE